ncbi:DUF1566 domain-containing protein [Maribellus sp. YY47]|uniref:Lcl domain-containing protein n=1 Tax=Maribellus sp. YY47 TaxID=2929486 RepID=UPI0020016518|nr:DUF1566 domain-containing protein [Maribellus sp. YY47]MCK3682848.1 DUF1566 domain-containing protein [Maribellus sp. YY47]
MKKLYTLLAAVFIAASVFAQAPEKMSYQAVIRNSSNQLVTTQQVGMQISILQGSANGTAVYVETQTPNTNANGLVSIEIGNGSVVSGNFTAIDWANGPYFIQSETDPTGGTNYTITGTSQLLSVPYALHAKTAESVTGGIAETDPVYTNSQAANITATDITNLSNLSGTNTGDQDLTPLATKIALADSTAKVRSEIPDVSGFISTEADPEFTNSEAANITAADITNLRNQSGTNTGDQDLSPLATKTALADSIAQVRSEIPNTADGSETKLTAGTNVTVTGSGTTASPYVVNAGGVTKYSVGDFAQGGIVFYVDETGQHGLVCAKDDQSTGIRWYAGTYGNTQAYTEGTFSGKTNTTMIIAAHYAIGNDGLGYAALACVYLNVVVGGHSYGDWYLPSKSELNMMFTNRGKINATALANGGKAIANDFYWSSTEGNQTDAWAQFLLTGEQLTGDKGALAYVRAIRAF